MAVQDIVAKSGNVSTIPSLWRVCSTVLPYKQPVVFATWKYGQMTSHTDAPYYIAGKFNNSWLIC